MGSKDIYNDEIPDLDEDERTTAGRDWNGGRDNPVKSPRSKGIIFYEMYYPLNFCHDVGQEHYQYS